MARLKKEVFSQPDVVEALAGYYRALVRLPKAEPDFVASLLRPTTTPMLSIWGRDDPGREAAAAERDFFEGEYRHVLIDDARHFVHREQPQEFNTLLVSWLDADDTAAAQRSTVTAARS